MNTSIIFFITALIISEIMYVLAIAVFLSALKKTGNNINRTCNGFISVVIAARNECQTIGKCLDALASQDYEKNMFEVIIADDRSNDTTGEIVKRYNTKIKNLTLIRIDNVPPSISPKKNALTQAINIAKGDIIAQTDADCIPPPKWISGMADIFDDNANMVAGVAPYFKEKGILNSFVRHEYLWNAALAAASIKLGHGTHASGRNLAFRKEVFTRLGGYGDFQGVQSGDDTLLLQRIRKYNPDSIRYLSSKDTHVYTHAPCTFPLFLRQRIRHMSTGKFFDPFIVLLGSVIYGFHLFMLVSLVLSVFSLGFIILFFAGFTLKCMADGLIARQVRKTIGLEVDWKKFIPNEFLLLIYMSVMPVLGLLIPVKWKEK